MPFLFTTCEPGFEAALKADVARQYPALRSAFARPGLVTFKAQDRVEPDAPRPSAWARVWGASLGPIASPTELLDKLGQEVRRLHVFARDPRDPRAQAAAAEARAQLLASARFEQDPRATPGESVADVIVAPGEPWVCGVHRHRRLRSALPGGALPVEVPDDAPSRAFEKLEQAIAWAELPLRAGQRAVEIGSAPGGAAYALLRRGLEVHGVDPAAMDPRLLAFEGPQRARLHWIRESLASVRWESLPARCDWLLCDVHLAPPVALHGLGRLVPAWRDSLRGAIVTLKMNDRAMREALPDCLARLRDLGFAAVECTHLPANRQELCAVAWRELG